MLISFMFSYLEIFSSCFTYLFFLSGNRGQCAPHHSACPSGHNRGDERSRYKHTLAHCRHVEDLTVIEGLLGVSELVLCHRASKRRSRRCVSFVGLLDMLLPTRLSKLNPCIDSVGVLERCVPLRLEGYGLFGPTLGKETGCSVPSHWRLQRISPVKVRAYQSSLPKVT